jgi:hypothetical protein
VAVDPNYSQRLLKSMAAVACYVYVLPVLSPSRRSEGHDEDTSMAHKLVEQDAVELHEYLRQSAVDADHAE